MNRVRNRSRVGTLLLCGESTTLVSQSPDFERYTPYLGRKNEFSTRERLHRVRVIALIVASLIPLFFTVSAGAHEGPHGGALFQGAGHKYHAELVQNLDRKHAIVYVLDGRAKKAVPVPAKTIELRIEGEETPLILKAKPAKEGDEKASEFVLTSDRLGKAIDASKVRMWIKVDADDPKEFTPED